MSQEARPRIVLDRVEYETSGGAKVAIDGAEYLGLGPRKSDGFTVLSIRKPGAERAFNIETGNVEHVIVRGVSFTPTVAPGRWRLREAELRAFIEGAPLEDWARPYFDPADPKYHGRAEPRPYGEPDETVTIEARLDLGRRAEASAAPALRGVLTLIGVAIRVAIVMAGVAAVLWLAGIILG